MWLIVINIITLGLLFLKRGQAFYSGSHPLLNSDS